MVSGAPREAILVACLLLIPLAGCMAMPPPGSATETKTLSILEGGQAEVNFRMEEGAEVAVSLRADRNVSWDIHSHPEEDMAMTWRSGDAREMDVRFTAPRSDVYSVHVMGGANAARVEVELRGAFTMADP